MEGEFGRNNIPIAIPLFGDEIFQKIPKITVESNSVKFGQFDIINVRDKDNEIKDHDEIPEFQYDYLSDEELIANYDIPRVVFKTTTFPPSDIEIGSTTEIFLPTVPTKQPSKSHLLNLLNESAQDTEEKVQLSKEKSEQVLSRNITDEKLQVVKKVSPLEEKETKATLEPFARFTPSTARPVSSDEDVLVWEFTARRMEDETTSTTRAATSTEGKAQEDSKVTVPSVFRFLPTLSSGRRDRPCVTRALCGNTTPRADLDIETQSTTGNPTTTKDPIKVDASSSPTTKVDVEKGIPHRTIGSLISTTSSIVYTPTRSTSKIHSASNKSYGIITSQSITNSETKPSSLVVSQAEETSRPIQKKLTENDLDVQTTILSASSAIAVSTQTTTTPSRPIPTRSSTVSSSLSKARVSTERPTITEAATEADTAIFNEEDRSSAVLRDPTGGVWKGKTRSQTSPLDSPTASKTTATRPFRPITTTPSSFLISSETGLSPGVEEELRQAVAAGLSNLGSFVLWSDRPRVVKPTRPSPVFTPRDWQKIN